MLKKVRSRLKDQKGFTLIELLAVIVILGILAAIAIPSVLGIIDNSKKDAHVANAQQIISAAKMAIASNSSLQSGTYYLTLQYLETNNYLDPVSSPDSLAYAKGDATLIGNGTTAPTQPSDVSCVGITNGKVISITLTEDSGSGSRGISRSLSDDDLKALNPVPTELSTKYITRSNVQ